MKNLIKYWRGNELVFLKHLLIDFPFLVIHELAHIIFNAVLFSKQTIIDAYFIEFRNGSLNTGLILNVTNKSKICLILGTLAPSIVWLSIIFFLGISIYLHFSLIYLTLLIYCFLGYKTANCSKLDIKGLKYCLNSMIKKERC